MKSYKQVVKIEKSIDDIFKLPCVEAVVKNGSKHYFGVRCVNDSRAFEGDWLCEDYIGNWHVERGGYDD